MKDTIVVDIGIIIQYLKSGQGLLPIAYDKYKMSISASTFTELLASKTFEDQTLEKEVLDFVDKYFSVENIDKKVANEATKLIRKHNLTLGSAFVAALSISQSLPLLTDNKDLFKSVEGLELLDLKE